MLNGLKLMNEDQAKKHTNKKTHLSSASIVVSQSLRKNWDYWR